MCSVVFNSERVEFCSVCDEAQEQCFPIRMKKVIIDQNVNLGSFGEFCETAWRIAARLHGLSIMDPYYGRVDELK